MSLDKNLFTLVVTPNKDDPNVIDLVDPAGVMHYRKQRVPDSGYKVEVYDPSSESLLITVTAPASTSKAKVLELCNPTQIVELKYTGTLSFRWNFKWGEHEFEWKREECYLLRKPDPPVLVAVTKEPAGRLKTSTIQILDYNLNRFDIDDRKGLEIVMLTALLTFHDANEAYHTPKDSDAPSASLFGVRRTVSEGTPPATDGPPVPPPKPAPKTGVDRIAEMQAIKGEYNEVTVEEEGTIEDYGEYCHQLLQDDAILFITIRSAGAEQVPKVVQVMEQTKRVRHKAGIEDEIHQYVLYDTIKAANKGPRRIKLDDDDKANSNKYTPPNSLTIHMSKIPMPELQPKSSLPDKHGKESKQEEKERKEREKKEEKERKERKEREKKEKKSQKEERKAQTPPPVAGPSKDTSPPANAPKPNRLTRPSKSSPPSSRPSSSHHKASSKPSSSNTAPPANWQATNPNYAQSFYGAYAPPPRPPYPPGQPNYNQSYPSYGQGWQGQHPPPPPNQSHHNTGALNSNAQQHAPSNVVSGLLGMLSGRRS